VTETHHITKDYDHRTGAKTINRYEFHETIGRGVHGKVKLARDTETGGLMAIKIVNRISKKRLGRMDPLEAESKVRREIAIMKKCVHPNVVALREVMDDPNSKKIYLGSLPYSSMLTSVLEYMAGGQLQWRDAENNPVLNIEQIRSIVRDTVLGLEYLHFQGIIHRDIKPANLLLSEDKHVKISDFGVSHLSKVDEETGQLLTENELELSKTAGSPAFFAPEICQTTASPEEKRPPITKAIDVWALGITLHCLLFGRTPFPETGGEFQLFNMICTEPIPIPPPEFEEEDVDEEVIDLLKRLLIKNAEDRITLEEVKRHPFILRTIPDPEKWIEETDPRHIGAKLEVTAEEVSAAVSITERVKRTFYKIQSSLSGLTGLRRRATTGKSVASSKRSASVSTIEPSSPDGRSADSPRQGSQISVDSMDQRISSGTSSSRPSPPQALSRKPSTTKAPPLPSQSENPAPLRPSRSVRSNARRPCDVRDTSAPSMPRSRAISDLSRGLNGETTNYLTDDYSNGLYFSDDLISHGSSFLDESEEEDEDEGHLLIDFGRRRRSRQEAENLAKQLEVSKLSGKIDEETASLASSGGSVKPKKNR
jgi:serine/threonine protein kinase